MKKLIILLLISLFWFSCELSDSGRMAVINFNVGQPDLVKVQESAKTTVPNRIIPMETKAILVVMYPDFSNDTTVEGTVPSQVELNNVLTQESTKTLQLDYSNLVNSNGSISNIEPGIWNFIALTYNSAINISSLNPQTALTYRIKKSVEIDRGFNNIDLPLLLNGGIYNDIGSGAVPMSAKWDSGTVSSSGISPETVFIGLNDFDAGENRIFFNPLQLVTYPTTLLLYSKEGYLLDSSPVIVNASQGYFTFISEGISDVLYISAIKESSASDILDFTYNGPGNYFAGPPHLLGNLTVYAGGV